MSNIVNDETNYHPTAPNSVLSNLDNAIYSKDLVPESMLSLSSDLVLAPTSLTFSSNRRQRPFAIANTMAQATDLQNLYQITVTEAHKHFEVDRALIYQFESADRGIAIAESLTAGYTPILGQTLSAIAFGAASIQYYQQQAYVRCDNIAENATTPHQVQLCQRFQIQASLCLPVFLDNQLWGLLALQTCDQPRQWNDNDITLLYQITIELTLKLQLYTRQQREQRDIIRERFITGLVQNIREAADVQRVFETTTRAIRQYLNTDRVTIVQAPLTTTVTDNTATATVSNPNQNSTRHQIRAESVNAAYASAQVIGFDPNWFGEQSPNAYRQGHTWAVTDIYQQGFSEYQIHHLAQLQIRATLIVPLIQAGQLWGVIHVHHCQGPRQWQDSEIAFVQRVTSQLNIALQQAEYIEQVNEKNRQLEQVATQERLITKITERLRKTTDLSKTLKATVHDIRTLLNADRVGMFQFDVETNYSIGEFVVEDVAPGIISAMATQFKDHCFVEKQADYRQGRHWVVHDIQSLELPDCLTDLLNQLQVRASLVVPLLKGDILWGLFCVHQCTSPRQWQDTEIEFAHRIGAQLNLALQQADYLDQLQEKNRQLEQVATQERLITKITERLRKTTDLSKTLKATVHDIRTLLNADRVGMFQFDVETNYSIGEFVVEDVAPGVVSAMATQFKDHCFVEKQADYRQGRHWVVHDIQSLELPDCLIDLLNQLQVRASLVVPLLKGDILWGLFCIHQCTSPRQWQDTEIEFAHRIGAQLNLALQQADYLDQLQEKNITLAETASQAKASKESLQTQVSQLLSAVRPALKGDLTVRAPIPPTEVGTVASAYNKTLQSLQKIVLEVQKAANKVGKTSEISEASASCLQKQAQQQALSLEQSLQQVQEMMCFTESVVQDAQQVEIAVQQANQTVQTGDAAMNRTVDGIITIRSTVADTNQRIKRLSESSQKISKIVSLISQFTNQTQLLSMNASIEATRAGKYGRGFAVVADEIRSLARRSADAATEIEQLVQEIQANTAEVSVAMETGIQQVAEGTKLVKDTRRNLTAIVKVTEQISQLIEGITQTTHQQASDFKGVALTVTEAAEIANQTSKNSAQLAQAIHQLLVTAKALQTNTGKFKVR